MTRRKKYKIFSKQKQSIKQPKKAPRETNGSLIAMIHGKFTTRINPINRHSVEGFAYRRTMKANRFPTACKYYMLPQVLTN